jgi:hypothetical protein
MPHLHVYQQEEFPSHLKWQAIVRCRCTRMLFGSLSVIRRAAELFRWAALLPNACSVDSDDTILTWSQASCHETTYINGTPIDGILLEQTNRHPSI